MQLTELFARLGARELTLVADHDSGRAAALSAGFADARSSRDFDPAAFGGVALWIISSRDTQQRLRALWDGFGGIIVHLIDAKAGGDPAAVGHALACLDAADLPAAAVARRQHYEQFLTHDLLRAHTGAATLTCRIGASVEVACDADALEPGIPYALTELLKASIVNIEAPTSTFRLDGELVFDDLLYQANNAPLLAQHAALLRGWRRLAAAGGENRLCLADNRITGLTLGGEDHTHELLALCRGKEWETNATECAVGGLPLPAPPALNTVFSQARRGLHIGLGMGEQLPFLDFCAPAARIEPDDD
jgi:hypothetical protein